jgi:hypothetical protein
LHAACLLRRGRSRNCDKRNDRCQGRCHKNSHVLIEAEVNLVSANGDLLDFPTAQKT